VVRGIVGGTVGVMNRETLGLFYPDPQYPVGQSQAYTLPVPEMINVTNKSKAFQVTSFYQDGSFCGGLSTRMRAIIPTTLEMVRSWSIPDCREHHRSLVSCAVDYRSHTTGAPVLLRYLHRYNSDYQQRTALAFGACRGLENVIRRSLAAGQASRLDTFVAGW
jgi:hypothetical protein